MSRKKSIALIAGAICFMSVSHRVSGADFRVMPAESSGELVSFSTNQCQQSVIGLYTGGLFEICHIDPYLPFEFNLGFNTTVSYQSLRIDVSCIHHGTWNPPIRYLHWSEAGICYDGDPACPDNGDGTRTYHGELDVNATAGVWSTPAIVRMDLKTERETIVSFEFWLQPLDFPEVG